MNFKQQSAEKPTYLAPTVTTYTMQELEQQLGPARAFSPDAITDEELLFGEEY